MATSKEQKETVYKSIRQSHYKYHQELGENSMALSKKNQDRWLGSEEILLSKYFPHTL